MTSYDLYKSKPGHTGDIAIFSPPRVNSAVDQTEFLRFKPVSGLGLETSVIHFSISNISPNYIDLSRSRLTVECKVVNGDKDIAEESMEEGVHLIPKESRVGISNFALYTMFHTVELSIQNQVLSPHVANNYHYKAMIDALCRNTWSPGELAAAMFYRDDFEFIKDCNTGLQCGNSGQRKRRLMLEKSRRFTLTGVLNHDICHQGRLLLNNLPLSIRLYPNKSEFILVSSYEATVADPMPNFKLQITDASMDICFVKLSASVLVSQDRVLHDNKRAQYPYLRSVIKTVNVPIGSQTFAVDDIYSSFLPSDFYCVFIDSTAYSGSLGAYGFWFENAQVSKIGLYINGQSAPQKPYETSFVPQKWNLGQYMDAYMGLLGSNPEQCNVTYQEFSESATIFRFELDKFNGNIFPKPRRGHARLEIQFTKALEKNYTLLMYGLFPSLMSVDSARSLYLVE